MQTSGGEPTTKVFRLVVTLSFGREWAITLDGNHCADTVGTLRARIAQEGQLQLQDFYLMHNASYLADHLPLEAYNIQEGSRLCMLMSDAAPGGGICQSTPLAEVHCPSATLSPLPDPPRR